MEFPTSADERAHFLLGRMRETPMRRGGLSKRAGEIKGGLSRAIAAQDVPSVRRTARRLARAGFRASAPKETAG